MDDRVEQYVARALEDRAAGRAVDLTMICADHPELIPEVERLLRIDAVIDAPTADGEAATFADPLTGSVLDDRYELHDCIGIGAMGSVYRATDRTLRRAVAAKLLQNGLFASQSRHERFEREARVLASLRHRHIVDVYDHGRSPEGLHYIVMEHLVGVPLSAILQQAEMDATDSHVARPATDAASIGRRLDSGWLRRHFDLEARGLGYLPQVVHWCRQVASALEAAHAAGVMHRDVKPTNIFVDGEGNAILLDFGIAAKAGDGALTAQGSTVGSPWYMAPEQVGSRGELTEQVDVYGLCATLYHLATLRPPYEGDYDDVLRQLATTEPAPPARVRPELSRDLCAVIEKGLERDPRRRYGTMRQLADDLQALTEQLPVRARPISRPTRWLRAVRRRPAPAVAMLLVLLAVAVTIPVVSHAGSVARAEAAAREERYQDGISALAPAMAFEGSFELRPRLDADEREGYLAQLSTILQLRPDDLFARLLRSALLLDRGGRDSVDDSTADIRWIVERHESPFLRAFLRRYEAVDTTRPGVLGLDLDDLPAPQTEADRVVLGFQLYRARKTEAAMQALEPATGVHARNIRLGLLKGRGKAAFFENGDRTLLTRLLVESELLEREQGCATARNLYYRGSALLDLRDYEGAETALALALQLCPAAFGTNFNLAIVRKELGQPDAALDLILAAKRLRPQNLNAVALIAELLAQIGDFDAAVAAIDGMERSGHLVEPWHRDFYRGFIEALRALQLFGEGRFEDALAAETIALDHYRTALAAVAPGTADHRTITQNIELLVLVETTPAQRVEKLAELLRERPTSSAHMQALANAVKNADALVPDPDVRRALAEMLELQAQTLAQRSDTSPK